MINSLAFMFHAELTTTYTLAFMFHARLTTTYILAFMFHAGLTTTYTSCFSQQQQQQQQQKQKQQHFSSVQDGIYALGKAHTRSTPSLRRTTTTTN